MADEDDAPVATVTDEERRAEVLKLYNLPETANASEVIQHAIEQSGHCCTLRDLMILARLFDGEVVLYVEERVASSGV